jgi:integrase
MKITDAKLRAAKPGETVVGDNLVFRFRDDGKAGIRALVRIAGSGKRVSLSLGRYPETTLAVARQEAANARALAAKGKDPRHERKANAEAQERLLGDCLQAYLAASENRARTVHDKKKTLEPAFADMAKRPIGSISKGDMVAVLTAYRDRPAARRKLFSYADHFCGFCIENDWITANPLQNVKKPPAVAAKERVLIDDEIRALMSCKANTSWLPIARLILLTGQRGGEISAMRVSEIDFQRREWRIPRENMKQGRAHVVHLSPAAMAIIKAEITSRHRLENDFYIFGDTGARPFSGRSKGQAMILAATKTSGWSGHDLRRTAITVMQRLGIHREIRMAVTGHAQPRDGASAYEHHDFRQEARAAVERLANEVARISSEEQTATVHPFPYMSRQAG